MKQLRTVFAIVLSLGAFLLIQQFFSEEVKVPPKTENTQNQGQTNPAEVQNGNTSNPSVQTEPTPQTSPSNTTPLTAIDYKSDGVVTIENDMVMVTFSKKGGVITNWVLKNYQETTDKDSPQIDLLHRDGAKTGHVFSRIPGDENLVFEAQVSGNQVILVSDSAEKTVKKIFILGVEGNPYVMDVTLNITNKTGQDLVINPQTTLTLHQKKTKEIEGFLGFLSRFKPKDLFTPLYKTQAKVEILSDPSKIGPSQSISGNVTWGALADRYFIGAVIPREITEKTSFSYGLRDALFTTGFSYGETQVGPQKTAEKSFTLFMGPKKLDSLEKLGIGLEKSVDHGWFAFVALPLLWFLIFLHGILGNWGLAIIALTFIVKLALHPINKKAMMSMKEMQKIQPQLKELQAKFKDNKERLNQEMMQLFKTHKVNPMGGCLPMIAQMPIYIALYNVLWNSIELYHSPFIWFYKDLSAPDPYYISPVLLGIFMVLQQRFTPQAANIDPAQQKIMMFMPLMFSVFLVFLPAGLVIYIFVNTFMSVVQQYMITHDLSFADLIKKVRGKK